MAENTWYPIPPKKRSKSPVIKCECCYSVKPKDKQRPCLACQAAGCTFDCGLWKRGEECPGRNRMSKQSKSGLAVRKIRRTA